MVNKELGTHLSVNFFWKVLPLILFCVITGFSFFFPLNLVLQIQKGKMRGNGQTTFQFLKIISLSQPLLQLARGLAFRDQPHLHTQNASIL